MREIRTSGSMSGVEETGLWKTSVSGWGESLPAQSAPTFLQVPRLPPTLPSLLHFVLLATQYIYLTNFISAPTILVCK